MPGGRRIGPANRRKNKESLSVALTKEQLKKAGRGYSLHLNKPNRFNDTVETTFRMPGEAEQRKDRRFYTTRLPSKRLRRTGIRGKIRLMKTADEKIMVFASDRRQLVEIAG